MSKDLQKDYSPENTADDQVWHLRWFLIRLYAIALLTSIPASVIIALLTKNPIPGLIPAPLLLSMRPIIRWTFSEPHKENQGQLTSNLPPEAN